MPPPNQIRAMDFPTALQQVTTHGRKVTRLSWGTPGVYVLMTEGFLKIHMMDGATHALIVCEGDLRGIDWVAVGDH